MLPPHECNSSPNQPTLSRSEQQKSHTAAWRQGNPQGRVQSSVLSGTGPCNEGCEEFAEMFHLTMISYLHTLRALPLFGASLQKPFREYLEAQRAKLQLRTGRTDGRLAGEATPFVSEDLFLI
ncbi:hypothetical protein F2P79_002071 [Pimephales promelas]|nr:hypothetical protein F2P79_002071 [Pimephales promelas]